MISRKNQKERILYLTVILIGLLLNVIIFNQNGDQNNYTNDNNYSENRNIIYQENDVKTQGIVEDSYTEEWLDNGNFTTGTNPWFNTTIGDDTDVNATYSEGAANYEIKGENGIFELYEDPPISSNWTRTLNPNFPYYPDTATINSEGIYVSHRWAEGADQSVSANWEHNVTLPVNMSDYEITSASLEAVCNATVDTFSADPPDYSNGIEAGNDYPSRTTQYATGDYIRFYVLISDRNKNNVFELGYIQTSDLGQDSPVISQMGDTTMVSIPEETLMFYLSSVLNADFYNFTVILGIRIWCEDNFPQDSDVFQDVIINSINLTFTYEKIVDQQTSLSWNQIGDKISGSNVDIEEATLNFRYKINETWPSALSSNSEIRIIINGTQYSETIKLGEANDTYGDAKIGGFDVTNLIRKNVNISLSIQVYLADEFPLDRGLKISIDNVSLLITYTVSIPESPTELNVYLNEVDKTLDKSINIAWRETVNITVTYKNKSSGIPILGATVDINGTGISEVLSPSGTGNYSVVINSTALAFGIDNYLTLHAEERYFESITIIIKIKVVSRPTSIENEMLNQVPGTSKQMQYNELLNITLSYNDTLDNGKFIKGATVAVNGSGISEPLAENSQKEYYTVVINTADMDVGIKFLTVTAELDNYTLASVVLTITVSFKETYLEVFIENKPTTDFSFYNVSIGAVLNFTVKFKEQTTHDFVDNANVSFIESGNVIAMPQNPFFEQYNLTINTTVLDGGVKFITFTAEKDNYTSSLAQTALIIKEKASEIQLFLDGNPTADNDKIEVQIYDIINVSVTFTDENSGAHLSKASGANVKFTGGDNFTENAVLKHYNFTLSALLDLSEGITILTIIAEMPNYVSSSIQFLVEVNKQSTNLTMWFNSVDVTLDPSIELPIGSQLGLTVNFTDDNGIHISDADIKLEVGYTANLTEGLNLYSVIIDTNLLNLGVNIISFTAQKTNFDIQTENLRILIRRIRTKIDTDDGEDTIEISPGESVTIKIEIDNLDFGGKIKGADVTYESKLGDGDLDEEDDGIYEVTLEDVTEGTYTIEIFVFKEGGRYEFEDFEITLIVKRPAEENLLFLILLIVAMIVSVALAGYLIAYQRILKYPKPVRKVRKYRRTLKKKNAPSVDIIGRDKAFKSVYSDFISTNLKKGKTSTEIAESDKIVKKSLKSSIDVITKKPVEK